MRKTVLYGIMVLVLAALAVPAQAQEQGQPEMGRPGMGPEECGPGMDQATAEAVQAAQEKFRAETLELRREIQLKRAELRVLFLTPQASKEEILAKYKELREAADRLDDQRLLQRVELGRKYPALAMARGGGDGPRGGWDGPGRESREPRGSQGREERMGRPDRSSGKPGQGPGKKGEIQEAREKLRARADGLHGRMRLKKAEMKVLLLTPGTTSEALLAKNKEIHQLSGEMGRERLLQYLEMIEQDPELALRSGFGHRPEPRF